MRVKFCLKCSAVMDVKENNNEWLKCYSCGYHEIKPEEWIKKEKEIKENQLGKTK